MFSPFIFFALTLFTLAILALSMSLLLLASNAFLLVTWTCLSLNSASLSLPLILDPFGFFFSSTVLFISSNVMLFSSVYMIEDKFIPRFAFILLFFIISMNILIFIPNLITLLLGWDGLGITSFILIIYYQNPKSLAAGILTALMNRVGDVMLMLSIALMLNLGHWEILFMWESPMNLTLALLIMIAAMTKSAQIPFSSWLPAAMAAPTPVSALVHSSTLVTAGVFLLFRFHYSLSLFPLFNQLLLFFATLTMLLAGMAAMTECDMKKIIALSTLSQLGVMMMSLSINLPNLTFFHLITHALFKALLFLAAGSMIHYHSHSQDLRFMGHLIFSSPLTLTSILIANLALCGAPFLAGFYSKDLILEYMLLNPMNIWAMALIMLATILTSSYSLRFMHILIWNSSNTNPYIFMHDKMSKLTTPMMMLSGNAIIIGFIMNWIMFNTCPEPALPFSLKIIPLMLLLMGAVSAAFLSPSKYSLTLNLPFLHFFISYMWFLQPLSSQLILPLSANTSFFTLKIIDNGWLQFLNTQIIFSSLTNYSNLLFSSLSKHPTFLLSLSFLSLTMYFL